MRVVVLNGGTATVKAALATVERGAVRMDRRASVATGDRPAAAFATALDQVMPGNADVAAIGHRVVHGGLTLTDPIIVDADVEATIRSLVPLAPLHNPLALEGLRVARDRLPDRPMVAVFDTAFHAGRPEVSRLYALSADVAAHHGLYRYGFHGIAHASLVTGVAAAMGHGAEAVTAVTLQLGQGCSACAVAEGRSVETSMGFTPLEGLMMGTRSGDVDPGLVLYLWRQGLAVDEVEALLIRRAGLLGVGGSADVRELLAAEADGDAAATRALALFVRRIVATVGAYFTLLDGRGALVFGGGIGEHSAEVRQRIAAGLSAWNVELDATRNRSTTRGPISAPSSRSVYVMPTDEESLIAAAVGRRLEEGT